MTKSLPVLEAERGKLLAQLAATGEMRRGSLTEHYRRCGKEPCRCKEPDHPGHGPYYAFTRKVAGKTQTVQLRPGPLLRKFEREVENYRQFRALTEQLLTLDEAICDLRAVAGEGQAELAEQAKKNSGRRSKKRPTGK
jgi:hypothetical protein